MPRPLYWLRIFVLLVMTAAVFSAEAVAQPRNETAPTKNSAASPSGNERRGPSFRTRMAAGELSRIEQQIQSLSEELAMLAAGDERERHLEVVRPQVRELLAGGATICRQPQVQKDAFAAKLNDTVQRLRDISGEIPRSFSWERNIYELEGLCANNSLMSALQGLETGLQPSGSASRQAQIQQEIRSLESQRDDVITAMSEDMAGTQVANNIPWLMLIIFGLGAAALWGLKLFSAEIQQELVSSGQIVQFVTILILLGVILALGLAQRLQAETLGTLLGGLAGYVLSQGVGRQERQRVINEIKNAANQPN